MIYLSKSIIAGIALSTIVVSASFIGVYYFNLDNNEHRGIDLSELPEIDIFEWARTGPHKVLYINAEVSPGTIEYPHIADGLYTFRVGYNFSGNNDWKLYGQSNHALNNSNTALVVNRILTLDLNNTGDMLAETVISYEGNGSYKLDYDYQPGEDKSKIPDPYDNLLQVLKSDGIGFDFYIFFEGMVIHLQLFPKGIFIGSGPASVEKDGEDVLISAENVNVLSEERYSWSIFINKYYFVEFNNFSSVLDNPFVQGLNNSIYNALE